jgi:hypothetical protein
MVRAVCGSHLSPVATCRQTVEVFYSAVHRLAADGYVREAEGYDSPVATCRQTVEVCYYAVHRLAAGGYVWEAEGSGCR